MTKKCQFCITSRVLWK